MSLEVPASRLFTNEINLTISRASRSARPVRLLRPLRAELEHWLFLESWEVFLPWRSGFHRQVTLYSDPSRFAWGGSFPGAFPCCISDVWDHPSISYHIAVQETLALANVLLSFKDSIRDSGVDVFVDSQALSSAWERQGSRSLALFRALDAGLDELQMLSLNTVYDKQNCTLKSELQSFCILCLVISRFIQQLP